MTKPSVQKPFPTDACHKQNVLNLLTLILMFHCVANVGKLAIFKDEEVVLLRQCLQLLAEGRCVVLLADIKITLDYSS